MMLHLVISVLVLLLCIADVYCGGSYYGGHGKGGYYGGYGKSGPYEGVYGGPGPLGGLGYGAGLGLGYPEAVPGIGFGGLNAAGFLGLPFLTGYGVALGIGPGIIG